MKRTRMFDLIWQCLDEFKYCFENSYWSFIFRSGEFAILKGTTCEKNDKEKYKNYETLEEAKESCKQDDGCVAIQHDRCINPPTFKLCPTGSNLIQHDHMFGYRNDYSKNSKCIPDCYLKPDVRNGMHIAYLY